MRSILICLLLCSGILSSQTFYKTPFAHTYSIVAVDSVTGEIGGAVQSHWFSVGNLVIWAESGVGAVATQSFVNVSFGPRGLALMKSGMTPDDALAELLSNDEGREVRQVALINADGHSAAFTGSNCISEAGHRNGRYFSVQANLMLKSTVWAAMEEAFHSTEGPLAERMVAALEAAENEGGDIRGKQSAALLVVDAKPSGEIWKDRKVDLRVEDHAEPIHEIRRLLKVHRAYEHMNAGDHALEKGDIKGALEAYGTAQQMIPENVEMKYWHAVTLANQQLLDRALPLFEECFRVNRNWKILTPRIHSANLLTVSDAQLKEILALGE